MLVIVSELFVLIQVLAFPGAEQINWGRLATTSLFLQWISLVSGAVMCFLRSYLKGKSLSVIVSSSLAVAVITTIVFTLMAQWLIWLDGFTPSFPDLPQLIRHSLIATIITAMLLRYFYVQQEARTEQRATLSARFDALQARIRPHFLFNSMNIIASLIHIDQDKAEEAIEDLSDLFRSSLAEPSNNIDIEREIELCKRYLRIEQHRLGERLKSQWRLTCLPDGVQIPPLTLQPLIENAVYHGIQPLEKGGIVIVDIARINDNIRIRVVNPVPTAPVNQGKVAQGNQIALENIRLRLNMLFGNRARIKTRLVEKEDDSEFETIITYPYGDNKHEHTDHR